MQIDLWESMPPGYNPAFSPEKPALTFYPVESSQPVPTVIVCPGGGYNHRAEHEGEPVARWLNQLGFSAFVLHYRVAPYRYPYPIMDGQRAVRLVRYRAADWNLDPERIGLLGFSAGGHLAAMVGIHFDSGEQTAVDPVERVSSRPDALVLCYPVISFGAFAHRGSVSNLLGADPDPALVDKLSGEKNVSPQTPPVFLWHTADDDKVPVENTLQLAAALRAQRVPYAAHIFSSGRHGLGLAAENPEVAVWKELCARWLRKQLRGEL
ncbi:MAG: alpha/beta hydrolase [Firmicutes bacterium]|nr:alpha/beta hydrolase [Bacillota bacterium]